jgi:hypothetical protein
MNCKKHFAKSAEHTGASKMGQAKIRAAEIANKKAQGNKTRRVDSQTLTTLLLRLSQVIVTQVPDHGYSQTADSRQSAVMMIDHYHLGRGDYAQLLEFREVYNEAVNRDYGVELATGIGAFLQDPDEILRRSSMPQVVQVSVGLLDTVIAVLGLRVGAIKFHNVA